MIFQLAAAELRHRPGRAAFLLGGYAFGVAVMVVLLAVGEAMLTQARDQALLGGGDLVVVPTGISPEMLKAGGATSLFLGLEQARFLQRQLLESPRAREELGVRASSPILDNRLVQISRDGRTLPAIATGEIPSRALAMGAGPNLLSGRWEDSDADRRWAAPSPAELFDEIDHFRLPYGSAVGDSTWAEWHYYNVVLDDDRWLYLSYVIGGKVGVPGEWGGRLLITIHEPGTGHRSFTRDVPDSSVRFEAERAEILLDPEAFSFHRNGEYQVFARIEGVELDLRIRPTPNHLFPPTELGGGGLVSGYVVPALHATAEGRVCLPGRPCEAVRSAPAYHDHNWGVWRDVSWEWGAASDGEVSLLFGAVRGEGVPEEGLFAYLVDGRGVRGLLRPRRIEFPSREKVVHGDVELLVPSRIRFEDARRGVSVDVEVNSRQITDMNRERDRYFLQMRGVATVREAGSAERRLPGFFETYVDP
jgi:hypothetical protein